MGKPGEPLSERPHRRFGVRLWLGIAFAGVGLITAGSVYLFVSDRTSDAINQRETEIALGRMERLGTQLGFSEERRKEVRKGTPEGYAVWALDSRGELLTSRKASGIALDEVPSVDAALMAALEGDTFDASLADGVILAAAPIRRGSRVLGAVVARAPRPLSLQRSLDALRRDRLATLAIAVGVALLISFLVASLITTRVKRLAAAAAQIAEGHLDIPLAARGRDEIGDLGRALERMRVALRETFNALSSERDRLSAIFAGLGEAVMVVSSDGRVRFSNPASAPLIGSDGEAVEQLRPWLRRAAQRGTAKHDALRIGDRLYALQARELPAEQAVLAVVRDRTEELRREIAEREFVSNAAHELRNPIAGITGAIEVLRAGAKDDPEARDHFLERLNDDAERISRLTESLLTLARMEAIGEGEAEAVGVGQVAAEAASAIQVAEGVELDLEVEDELTVRGDPVLLRQVLIGLLANAYKNTQAPGTVSLRAHARRGDGVMIEVSDTGEGIPAEELGRVFERFYRGSGQLERGGFGLGLAIAKRMVDVMGGEIGVRSEQGRGSTFWIRLPAAKPSPAPVA